MQLFPSTDWFACLCSVLPEVAAVAAGKFSKICIHVPAKTLRGQYGMEQDTWIFHIALNRNIVVTCFCTRFCPIVNYNQVIWPAYKNRVCVTEQLGLYWLYWLHNLNFKTSSQATNFKLLIFFFRFHNLRGFFLDKFFLINIFWGWFLLRRHQPYTHTHTQRKLPLVDRVF